MQPTPALDAVSRRLVTALALALLTLGGAVLCGWWMKSPYLVSLFPHLVSMKPNTALCFVLLGAALLCGSHSVPAMRVWAGRASAGVVALVAAVTMAEYLRGWDLHIDELLFEDSPQALQTFSPGRMSRGAAIGLLASALSFLTIRRGGAWTRSISVWLAVTSLLIGYLTLLGYAYDLPGLYRIDRSTAMALHTSVGLILLNIALLLEQPGHRLLSALTAPGAGSLMGRWLILAAVVIPLVLGVIRVFGERAGWWSWSSGATLAVMLSTVMFVGLTWAVTLAAMRLDRRRQQAEAELRESQYNLQDFLERGAVGLHWVAKDGTILWANEADYAPLGYSREEYIGQPITSFHADQAVIGDILARLKNGETLENYEAQLRCKDGSVRDVLITSNVRRGERGEFVHTRCFTRDITERKQVERERERLLVQLQQQAAQIQAALNEKEVLLKEIHHRVKNNLQVISSLLMLQSDSLQDPVARGKFRDSQSRIHAMALVHEQLYQAADLSSIELGPYMRQMLGMLCQSYAVSGRIGITVEADPVTCGVDVAIPCALLVNELVTNALRHAFPEGHRGTVALRLRRLSDREVQLVVEDSGVGLPAGLDIAQAESLGLRLVRALTEQIGGQLSFASSAAGTTFDVRFAVAARAKAADTARDLDAPQPVLTA